MRRILLYLCGVICLTRAPPCPLSLGDLFDQRSQMQEIVRAQPCAAGRALSERVGFINVGPGREQRAQPTLIVEEHHPIFAPVLLTRGQHEAAATPRVERVRDFELY